MCCDICKCGRMPEDLHEVTVYGAKFWLCFDCKNEIEAKRVRL